MGVRLAAASLVFLVMGALPSCDNEAAVGDLRPPPPPSLPLRIDQQVSVELSAISLLDDEEHTYRIEVRAFNHGDLPAPLPLCNFEANPQQAAIIHWKFNRRLAPGESKKVAGVMRFDENVANVHTNEIRCVA
jgi:hypothetical protein